MCLISGRETSWPSTAHGIIIFSFSLQQGSLIATASWEVSPTVLFSGWCWRIVCQRTAWPRSKLCHHQRVQTGECQCPKTFYWPQSFCFHVHPPLQTCLGVTREQNKLELHEQHTEHMFYPRITSGKPDIPWNTFSPTLGNPSPYFRILALC